MSLVDFLLSERQQRVLGALFLHPDRGYSLSDLIRIGGSGKGGTQRIVEALESSQVVTRERMGNQVIFRVNRLHPLFQELRSICLKSFGLADVIRAALAPFGNGIRNAFIFGSVAHGTDRPDSDVDLMVIGDVDPIDLNARIEEAEAKLGRQIHVNAYGSDEWLSISSDSVIQSITNGNKITVIGDERPGEHRESEADRSTQGCPHEC